ncbi:hypothetical protein SuUB7_20640 [Streptococcus uberis]
MGIKKNNLPALPSIHRCDCGQFAVTRRCSSWICDRCLALERRYYGPSPYGKLKRIYAASDDPRDSK